MAMGMSESEPQTEATVNVCFHTSFKQVKKDKKKPQRGLKRLQEGAK